MNLIRKILLIGCMTLVSLSMSAETFAGKEIKQKPVVRKSTDLQKTDKKGDKKDENHKDRFTVSGDLILRPWDVSTVTTSGIKKDNFSYQLGGRLRGTYQASDDLSVVARVNIGYPEKPYCRYITLNGDFDWYLDEMFAKKKIGTLDFYFGRHFQPYLDTRSDLVMSRNIPFDGISAAGGSPKVKFHAGYARLTEGTATDAGGNTHDRDNTLRYAGVEFGTPKRLRGRITVLDYELDTLNPFGPDHAAYGKYYAYSNDYRLVNLALCVGLKRSGIPSDFMCEYCENTASEEADGPNDDHSAYYVGISVGTAKKRGDVQAILGYFDVGQKSVIGYYTSCGNRVNSEGIRINLSLALSDQCSIKWYHLKAHRKNESLAGPFQSDRRNAVMLQAKF